LAAIAANGPEYFYAGPLGEKVVAHLKKLGGTLTMADLAAATPVWREPTVASFNGLAVHVPPPPCEGFQFLLTLRLLDGHDFASKPRNGVEHLDTVLRAVRLAAGQRIAHNYPTPEKLAEILSDKAVAVLRSRLADGKPITGPTEQWTPTPGEDPGHTTSFSIGDREGNLICVTQSLGAPFGSGVVVPGTGLCLNNFLYWTDVQKQSPNLTKPGAALPICMAPSISLADGEPVLALGTPGSYGILQTQAQAMVQHIAYGEPLQDAIEAPRARLWDGRHVQIENRIGEEVIAALRSRGHDAERLSVGWTMKVGGMQAVRRDPASGALTGAADPRRDGYVAMI
jgi:gamma-glutamyltranspeptidase/glutathione hydrolase